MAQIFPKKLNYFARLSIVLGALSVGGCVVFLNRIQFSRFVSGVDQVHEQPVPFSHEHHVRGLGMDCRFCHTSVEKSSFAGIPPTKTCMICHSQIWADSPLLEPVRESFQSGKPLGWVRVHNLPDYVYFDHSVHVAKGVACVTCHGPVDRMPLTWQHASLRMKWCLECHRAPANNIRPREAVFSTTWVRDAATPSPADLMKRYQVKKLTDCAVCHR